MSKLTQMTGETEANEPTVLNEADIQRYVEEVQATVDSGDTKLDEYRAAFKEALDEDTTLSDSQIVYVIATTEIDGPDMDAAVLAMKELQDSVGGTVAGDEPDAVDTQKITAASTGTLAEKLAQDDAFRATMDNIIAARETIAIGPVSVLVHLERIWNDDDWAMVPVPGSTRFDGKVHRETDVTGNAPHDLTRAKEGNRVVVISWYKESVRAIAPKHFTDLDDINETFKAPDKRELNNEQRKAWAKLPLLKRMSMQKKFTTRVGSFRSVIENAVWIRITSEKIQSLTVKDDRGNEKPVVGIDFDWADKKAHVLNSTTTPILMWDNTVQLLTEKVGGSYTVMTFLKLDVDRWLGMKTEAYTPTYVDLDATLTRDKEATAAAKLAAKFKIENVKEFEISFATNASWMDEQIHVDAFKKYRSGLNDKSDAANPILMTEKEQFDWMVGEALVNYQMNLHPIVMPSYRRLKDLVDAGTKRHPADDAPATTQEPARKTA